MTDPIKEAFERIEARNRQIRALRYELKNLLDENDEDINTIKKECEA